LHGVLLVSLNSNLNDMIVQKENASLWSAPICGEAALWQHTRKNGTHNRFFAGLDALVATLTRVFGEMQSHPQLIRSYLTPFC
jgi:hypothetical protein